ncbi:MAG: ABC transporter permease [Actinomycetaceae bacterium]|jgi:NitT/TauT family transport system permease protein|nr:ABC transporter permease [Actinomycetaceae bacterium]
MGFRRGWLPPLEFGLALLALWWASSTFALVDQHFLPTPQSAVSRLLSGLQSGYLWRALLVTLKEAVAGCVIAAAIGIPLGYAIAKSRVFSRISQPYLAASQAIPAVAIAPLLTIWIGHGLASVVVLCTIMVIFPIAVSTSVGVRQIDPEIIGAARLDGAAGLTLIRRIEVPLAAPTILSGIRTGFTLSITGAIVGEMVMGGEGLGLLLGTAQQSSDVKGLFAIIILLAISAVSIYGMLLLVERRANYLIS